MLSCVERATCRAWHDSCHAAHQTRRLAQASYISILATVVERLVCEWGVHLEPAWLATSVYLTMTHEVHVPADGRHVIDEKFQALVLDEIAGVKAEVQAEKDERISEDEQIVGAINEYTRALQDGLRIVSS